jgi:hypothetical protein
LKTGVHRRNSAIKLCLAILTLIAAVSATPVCANGSSQQPKITTEAEVKRLSDAVYTWLLEQAIRRGHHYSAEVIASGYKRHFEELKVQLIDQGYTILAGEAGT